MSDGMFALIVLIVFSLGIAFFATQNTGTVHILFGNYLLSGIPIYMVVISAILLGVFMSWLISVVDSFSSFLTLRGKEVSLRKAQGKIEKLQKENEDLSLEIANLKGQKGVTVEKKEPTKQESAVSHPSLFPHLRHTIT